MPISDRGQPALNVAAIKAALPLADTISRISGIRLEQTRSGARACCPFHQERTPSFVIDDTTGRYRCYGAGCGAHGDIIQFIRDWYSVDFRQALQQAGQLAGISSPGGTPAPMARPPNAGGPAWRSVLTRRSSAPGPALQPSSEFLVPVPDSVALPQPGRVVRIADRKRGRVIAINSTHVHPYRSQNGALLCLVCRAEGRRGKFFIQAGWGAESGQWEVVRFPRQVARPLYGLQDIDDWPGRRFLLVDGEKTRDAAARLLPCRETGLLTVSAMGGCGAVHLADWTPLLDAAARTDSPHPCQCLVWPDADRPVTLASGQVVDRQQRFARDSATSITAALASRQLHIRFARILPPDGVAGGWDLADAVAEGWSTGAAERHLDRFTSPFDPTGPDSCPAGPDPSLS